MLPKLPLVFLYIFSLCFLSGCQNKIERQSAQMESVLTLNMDQDEVASKLGKPMEQGVALFADGARGHMPSNLPAIIETYGKEYPGKPAEFWTYVVGDQQALGPSKHRYFLECYFDHDGKLLGWWSTARANSKR